MGKFLNFFMLITFAYTMVKFYDSSIPGLGYLAEGIHQRRRSQYLVSVIGTDSVTSIQNTLNQAQSSKTGPGITKALMNPYYAIVYVIIQVLIAILAAVVSAIIAYGAIASAVIGLLGPVFIPFLVFNKLEFLFWGWLRAFMGFCFYKVLAAAVFSILAHVSGRVLHAACCVFRPRQYGPGTAVADSLGPRQCLHPVQDSGHDAVPLQRSYGRRQQWPRHGDDGDTGNDLIAANGGMR